MTNAAIPMTFTTREDANAWAASAGVAGWAHNTIRDWIFVFTTPGGVAAVASCGTCGVLLTDW